MTSAKLYTQHFGSMLGTYWQVLAETWSRCTHVHSVYNDQGLFARKGHAAVGEGETSLSRFRFRGGKIVRTFKLLQYSCILSTLCKQARASVHAYGLLERQKYHIRVRSHKYLAHSTRKIIVQESL